METRMIPKIDTNAPNLEILSWITERTKELVAAVHELQKVVNTQGSIINEKVLKAADAEEEKQEEGSPT